MSQTIAEHRRNRMYADEGSIRRRAEKTAKPTEIDNLRVAHLDEKTALGARHRQETMRMVSDHQRELARDPAVANGSGNGSPTTLKRQKAARAALEESHARDRAKMADRHRAAMEAAIKRNPAP